MSEENPETGKIKPETAYRLAWNTKQEVKELKSRLDSLEKAIEDLVSALKNTAQSVPHIHQPSPNVALRPGQMIHNVIAESEDGIVEEVVCPTCGTRELRKIPTKIIVKEKPVEKPVIPEGYIPAPRSSDELFELLQKVYTPDGKPILSSEKAVEKLAKLLEQYGYELRRKR